MTPLVWELHRQYLRRVWGMNIARGARIALSAKLDRTHPRGIHVGEDSVVTFEAAILTHDAVNGRHLDVVIGRNCLIGARSIIYPGVVIGDHVIVSAASVVMKDVPAHSLVAGNPARVVETKVETGAYGRRFRFGEKRLEIRTAVSS